MSKNELDKYLNERISEETGIPLTELTLEKIQAIAETSNYPEVILSSKGGKIEIDRVYLTREEVKRMREENDKFLGKYRK